jgi:hypothetical protein
MRAIVRDTYGSPDVLELPRQALGFRVQAYGVTQHKDLFARRQFVALTTVHLRERFSNSGAYRLKETGPRGSRWP